MRPKATLIAVQALVMHHSHMHRCSGANSAAEKGPVSFFQCPFAGMLQAID